MPFLLPPRSQMRPMPAKKVETMTVALISGLTGTWGQALLEADPPWTIRGLSRDELKQSELREQYPNVRWLLGDVRDRDRLRRAMEGCDTVVHAAALKRVDAGEYDPGEFIKTNVLGTMNVAECALDCGVEKAVLLSSDKAVSPANLYGSTKLCAERYFLAANAYGGNRCKFSVVRYGNVKGSRGSLLAKTGPVTLTDARATRFWMEPSEAVDLVLLALREMQGGEVFVPKIGARLVADMVEAVGEPATGLRPGEKLHEALIAPEEVSRTYDFGDHYRVLPAPTPGEVGYLARHPQPLASGGQSPMRVPADFSYTSENCA